LPSQMRNFQVYFREAVQLTSLGMSSIVLMLCHISFEMSSLAARLVLIRLACARLGLDHFSVESVSGVLKLRSWGQLYGSSFNCFHASIPIRICSVSGRSSVIRKQSEPCFFNSGILTFIFDWPRTDIHFPDAVNNLMLSALSSLSSRLSRFAVVAPIKFVEHPQSRSILILIL
jgi:hypothetical protein